MRAYKFLDETFGLKTLTEKRLKISTLEDLNDPFELIPFDLRNREVRVAVKNTREQLARTRGMLCFSATWSDPVLWAHYANKHKGICIGFEIPDDDTELPNASDTYLIDCRLRGGLSSTMLMHCFLQNIAIGSTSKKYESISRLENNQENGKKYFRPFDETLRPVVIIAGARCKLSRKPAHICAWKYR